MLAAAPALKPNVRLPLVPAAWTLAQSTSGEAGAGSCLCQPGLLARAPPNGTWQPFCCTFLCPGHLVHARLPARRGGAGGQAGSLCFAARDYFEPPWPLLRRCRVPRCRWMGGTRFVVGALQQILLKKKHAARVAVLDPSAGGAAAAGPGPAAAGDGEQKQDEALAAAAAFEGPPVQHLTAFQQLAGR